MDSFIHGTPDPDHTQLDVARGLNKMGVLPGAKVASIGGGLFSHWYRLARVQIVAEVPTAPGGAQAFWKASREQQEKVFESLGKTGASVVVVDLAPPGQDMTGWQKIEGTNAYVYFLTTR